MNYRYAQADNYEDFAAGRVLFHRPGNANFPVRLAKEIFLRSASYLPKQTGLTVYDPCCGGGYLLTVLGFLCPEKIGMIVASDIDDEALAVARKNLALLTPEGLRARIDELESFFHVHQKDAHKEALASAKKLLAMVLNHHTPIKTHVFQANALDEMHLDRERISADIAIADVPYGELTEWSDEKENALDALLLLLENAMTKPGVIALCSDKGQKITKAPYRRLEKQQIGRRRFELYLVD